MVSMGQTREGLRDQLSPGLFRTEQGRRALDNGVQKAKEAKRKPQNRVSSMAQHRPGNRYGRERSDNPSSRSSFFSTYCVPGTVRDALHVSPVSP